MMEKRVKEIYLGLQPAQARDVVTRTHIWQKYRTRVFEGEVNLGLKMPETIVIKSPSFHRA